MRRSINRRRPLSWRKSMATMHFGTRRTYLVQPSNSRNEGCIFGIKCDIIRQQVQPFKMQRLIRDTANERWEVMAGISVRQPFQNPDCRLYNSLWATSPIKQQQDSAALSGLSTPHSIGVQLEAEVKSETTLLSPLLAFLSGFIPVSFLSSSANLLFYSSQTSAAH